VAVRRPQISRGRAVAATVLELVVPLTTLHAFRVIGNGKEILQSSGG
jgi:hypothetical protein